MKPTISLAEAAKLLGISRATAYTAAQNGTFPTDVIRIETRYIIPTKPLLDLLHLEELPTA